MYLAAYWTMDYLSNVRDIVILIFHNILQLMVIIGKILQVALELPTFSYQHYSIILFTPQRIYWIHEGCF